MNRLTWIPRYPMHRKMLALVIMVTLVMMVSFLGALGARRENLGTPIVWDVNGHAYEVVDQHLSWPSARDFAASQLLMGVPGHLATITSAEENDFVVSVINAFESSQGVQHNLLWLGGEQIPHNAPNPAEDWTWITGELWSYTNWAPGEPNDAAGGEYYLAVYGSGNPNSSKGTWNDDFLGEGNTGFIIEWSPARPADITGPDGVPDGCVDAFDLGALLAAWCSVAGGNPCGTCFP
ncbi:MAG: hypothetical protein IH983_01465 [Planctomycetes bacterium]|nr:hypothetical protein [Planctomycetota bacterium]